MKTGASGASPLRMLENPEDGEDLNVGISELQERLETPEEEGRSIMQIAKQARNEKVQHIFELFRQGEEEVCITSLAKKNAPLKSLAELERRCQYMMQEAKLLSERQEVLKGMVEDKIRLQSRATEKYYEQIFEEMKEVGREKVNGSLVARAEKAHFDVISK